MSHPALPDDPADWPKNPAELLGVEPGADARELRRAYTRLIRVYKPEQEPEKFQRIRAAYELLLRMRDGRVVSHRFTIVEGWSIRDVRAALSRETPLVHDTTRRWQDRMVSTRTTSPVSTQRRSRSHASSREGLNQSPPALLA